MKILRIIFFAFLLFLHPLSAAILLNTGFGGHINNKSTTAVSNTGEKIKLPNQNFFFPGIALGFDVPIMPNSFGLIGNSFFGFAKNRIAINKYNIQNYEYSVEREKLGEVGVIQTDGILKDANLQREIEKEINNNNKDYQTVANDFVFVGTLLFRYSFPVEIPLKNKAFVSFSKLLSIINPYIAAGFSNVIYVRQLELNKEIRNSLEKTHGVDLISAGDQIVGKDPTPDPDFYLTWGVGFNILVPDTFLLNSQVVVTLEVLWHQSLSPGDQEEPFDDAYLINQSGMSFRIAIGQIF